MKFSKPKISLHTLLVSLLALTLSLFSSSGIASASPESNPQVSWTSPSQGSVVEDSFIVGLVASDTSGLAKIVKWCFKVDNVTDFYTANPVGQAAFSGEPDNSLSRFTKLTSDGCYEIDDSTTAKLKFFTNPQASAQDWFNGTHTITAQVTDSTGKMSNIASLTLEVRNDLPQVTWITDSTATNINGRLTLLANSAKRKSGAAITMWCLQVQKSSPKFVSISGTFSGSSGSGTYGNVYLQDNKCTANPNNFSLDSAVLSVNTETLDTGDYVFRVRAWDINGWRSSWSELPITITNNGPSVSWQNPELAASGGISSVSVIASADSHSSAVIYKLCFSLPNGGNLANLLSPNASEYFKDPRDLAGEFCLNKNSAITSDNLLLDTSQLSNGRHPLRMQAFDNNNRESPVSVLNIEVQRPRPAEITSEYSQDEFNIVGSVLYVISQPMQAGDNPAIKFSIQVDSIKRCEGNLSLTSQASVKCQFRFGELADGNHAARLLLELKDGQFYEPFEVLNFQSDLILQPKPELLSLAYTEEGYEAFASVSTRSELGAYKILDAFCSLDVSQEMPARVDSDRIYCSDLGEGLGTRSHNLKVKLRLENNLEVIKIFRFQSKLAYRPFPKLTGLQSNSINDWQQKLEFGFSSVEDDSPIDRVEWYLNSKQIRDGRTQGNTYLIVIDSRTIANGSYIAKAKIFLENGQTKTISKALVIKLLPPPPPAPTVSWSPIITNNIWKSGNSLTISGTISSSGQISKTVSMRTWQLKSGWSSWRTVSVAKNGRFSTSMMATSNTSIELNVPRAGRTPAATSKTSFKVYGVISVSAPKRISQGSRIFYSVDVQPKWSGYVSCTYKVERFNQFGVPLGEPSYSYPVVKVTNGIGIFSPGTAEYKYNHLTLACGVDWYGLESTSRSSGSTMVSVF